MAHTFTIEMLPAREGDCLWLSWGDPARPFHALIDGGRMATTETVRARLDALPAAERRLELLMISHIDRDHIEGVLTLLTGGLSGVAVGDVWFNGRKHLKEAMSTFGPLQGEALTDAITLLGLNWNAAFNGKVAMVPDEGDLPTAKLAGGMSLTLLSPTRQKLAALLPKWDAEIKKAGLAPDPTLAAPQDVEGWETFGPLDVDSLAAAPFQEDRAEPNGSSLAVLAEYDGRRALLTADAHPGVIVAALDRLPAGTLAADRRLRVDACKVAHHGSTHNTSPALLSRLDCGRYLISTNGNYFKHPDAAAVARIIKHGGESPEIAFNYRSDKTEVWDSDPLRAKHGYRTVYPAAASNGYLKVEL